MRLFSTGTFIGNSFGPGGVAESSYKVRAQVRLNDDLDTFSGPFKTEIFDLAGNVIATFTGTVTAKRIRLELLN